VRKVGEKGGQERGEEKRPDEQKKLIMRSENTKMNKKKKVETIPERGKTLGCATQYAVKTLDWKEKDTGRGRGGKKDGKENLLTGNKKA